MHVTLLGHPLPPGGVGHHGEGIADTGANIDRIVRMARYPVTAIEFHVSGTDVGRLRALLAARRRSRSRRCRPESRAAPPGRRLIVMDVDSTLVQSESIDMLADRAGVGDAVAEVTERAMRGEIDFEESLRGRVALLAGLDAAALYEVCDNLVLAPGARTLVRTLNRLGYRFAVVVAGFSQITDRLAQDLAIDYARANELEIVDGKLTGRVVGTVVDREEGRRAARLRRPTPRSAWTARWRSATAPTTWTC